MTLFSFRYNPAEQPRSRPHIPLTKKIVVNPNNRARKPLEGNDDAKNEIEDDPMDEYYDDMEAEPSERVISIVTEKNEIQTPR